MTVVDNESTWDSKLLTQEYSYRGRGEQSGTCLFAPELAILGDLWHELSGRRILDLGVGGGRTTPYLLALSNQYVALDYSPGMVAMARQAYPTADIRQGDARDLAAFSDGSVAFVLFSFNGIDMVPHEHRGRVLQEVHRVLVPGGYFAFSTHNLNHLDGEVRGDLRRLPIGPLSMNPIRSGVRVGRWARRSLRRYANHRRFRSAEESGDGYAVLNDGTHDYAFLTCYVDPSVQCDDLERSGFAQTSQIIGRDGRPTSVDSTDLWLYFLAKKVRQTDEP